MHATKDTRSAGLGLLLLVGCLMLVALAWAGTFGRARAGLTLQALEREGVPLLYLAPREGEGMPGVVVAHGFAGSKQLMLGYAHTLAHAGYAVMLLDFSGHGANPAPLQRDALQRDLEVALAALAEQPGVDGARLALLGHSMGSGAVMEAAIRQPTRFAATVAISPTRADVSADAPRNLQLQAGRWEQRFVANAEALLRDAGGASDAFGEGGARGLVLVPAAEHISILFRPQSHHAALAWLDRAFGRSTALPYRDQRMLWYGLHLLAWLGILWAMTMRRIAPAPDTLPLYRRVAGLLAAPLVAGAALWALGQALPVETLGGLLVGAAIALWLLVAGLLWLSLQGLPARPQLVSLVGALLLFQILWMAFGALGQSLWLQWIPVGRRALLILPLALLCLPWFLAMARALSGTRGWGWLGWWALQSAVLIVGFLALLLFVPALGFVVLLVPLWPLFVALFTVAAARLRDPWATALGSALFFGWLLAVVFPLAA